MHEELRCPNGILFGTIIEPGVIEVKCRSNRCGHGSGVVILHRFSTLTGESLETLAFKDPTPTRRKPNDAANSAALRSA